MQATISIPPGVEIRIGGGAIAVKGPMGEINRELESSLMKIKQEEGGIRISSLSERKKDRAVVGTWEAHIKNMLKGVTRGWEARMKVVYSHFPIKLSVEGDRVIIGNYLGERGNRSAKIVHGVDVRLEKEAVLITGIDKEAVGQTAANIELASRVKRRDRRVFQDGCYITEKPRPRGGEK